MASVLPARRQTKVDSKLGFYTWNGLGPASKEADKGGLLPRFLYLEPLDGFDPATMRQTKVDS